MVVAKGMGVLQRRKDEGPSRPRDRTPNHESTDPAPAGGRTKRQKRSAGQRQARPWLRSAAGRQRVGWLAKATDGAAAEDPGARAGELPQAGVIEIRVMSGPTPSEPRHAG